MKPLNKESMKQLKPYKSSYDLTTVLKNTAKVIGGGIVGYVLGNTIANENNLNDLMNIQKKNQIINQYIQNSKVYDVNKDGKFDLVNKVSRDIYLQNDNNKLIPLDSIMKTNLKAYENTQLDELIKLEDKVFYGGN